MPTALTVIKCRYSRCSYSSTEKERIKDHNEDEHFECPFCGPIGELHSLSGYNAHLISTHNTYDFGVIPQKGTIVIPQKGTTGRKNPCRFAPRCPYTGPKPDVERHSRCLHMECPVNGCDAFISKTLFFKHIKKKHRDQSDVQCPRDACSSRDMSLRGYWHHALSHVDTGSEEHILHPGMDQCTFAPMCPYIGERRNVKRHSLHLHIGCPVNGCDAFLSQNLFFKHIKENHRGQCNVQCPRDACSSRDMSLGGYWYHAQSHINEGDEENIQDICAEVEPETAGEPPLSLEEFLAMNDSGGRGMEQEGWSEPSLSLEELLAMNESGAQGMEQEGWLNATKWNDDWDMLGQ